MKMFGKIVNKFFSEQSPKKIFFIIVWLKKKHTFTAVAGFKNILLKKLEADF